MAEESCPDPARRRGSTAEDTQPSGMPGSSSGSREALMALRFSALGGDGAQLLTPHPATVPCGFQAFGNLQAHINRAILQRSWN